MRVKKNGVITVCFPNFNHNMFVYKTTWWTIKFCKESQIILIKKYNQNVQFFCLHIFSWKKRNRNIL